MRCFCTGILLLFFAGSVLAQPAEISRYNVTWTTQSENSAGSMPCGGGDIGINVWVEKGDLLFYLSRNGAFDHNNQLLKSGRVRLKFPGAPFDESFKQELKLADGNVEISGKGLKVLIWVDVFRPVVHVSIHSSSVIKTQAIYETWRTADREVTGTELRANSYKFNPGFPVYTSRDSVLASGDRVMFFHQPSGYENIFDYTVRMEKMESVKRDLFDPVKNNIFGGVMQGRGMISRGIIAGTYADTDFQGYVLESAKPVRSQEVEVVLHVAQEEDLVRWKQSLVAIQQDAAKNAKTSKQKTIDWWHQFWDRSYIFIEGKDSFVSRNYQLFRYMLGCNAYGRWPTKFNGGLFTFDPSYVDKRYTHTPDFRLWGGGTMTAQNQRLVYFPMLKSGDFDMMIPQFDFYLNTLKNAEARSRLYWNHAGASFTEQIENFGLPNIAEYGIKRPEGYDAGMEYNAWLEYQWETVFEFCLMILETNRYASKDISKYLPLIQSCVDFYDEHYRYLAGKSGAKIFDQDGRYIFYPSSAAESYKMTYNSTTVISALRVILPALLDVYALQSNAPDEKNMQKCREMLTRLPAVPVKTFRGLPILAPAEAWSRIQNSEAPQLYPVFPWGLYGVGKSGLDTARNTYAVDTQVVKYRSHVGWRQHNIFAARLGLTAEAQELTRLKFADGPHRFPAFWGPGFDWTPDHNWGGAAMIGLQEMLMQVDGKRILLLPAWPADWNAKFKLRAPFNTIVEGEVKDGKMVRVKVTPEREFELIGSK